VVKRHLLREEDSMHPAPKLIPWLARRAKVSDALALRLWRRADQEAQAIAGSDHGPEYAAIAIDRLLNLLEIESNGEASFEIDRHAWVWRHPQRMARCTTAGTISVLRIWNRLLAGASRQTCNC
jgi:hypothetical protein